MAKRVFFNLLICSLLSILASKVAVAEDALERATPNDSVDQTLGAEVEGAPAPVAQPLIPPVPIPKAPAVPATQATVPEANPLIDVPELSNSDDDIPLGNFSSPPLGNDFAGAPPVPGTMRSLAEGEAPEEYTIEDGDTLIDICDQLLDEPGYWPKLWSLNPEIKNPHFIFPLMRLRFYPGDDDIPPYLQVVSEDDVVPIDKDNLLETQLISEPVNQSAKNIKQRQNKPDTGDPTAEKLVTPVVKAFQKLFAEVIGIDQVEDLPELPMMGGRIFVGSSMVVNVPGFIYGEEVDPSGFVIAGRLGQFSAGQGEELIVESEKGLQAGSKYTILRNMGKVLSSRTDDRVGYKYEYVATVRLDRDLGESRFRGIIQSSRLGVEPNDVLVPFINIERVIPSEEMPAGLQRVEASIVSWENQDQENGGRGNYAYIDKGRSEGVSVGANLAIYSTPGYLIGELSELSDLVDYQQIGIMRIIDVTDVAALGYIINNTSEVRVGDLTYKP